MLQRYLEGNKSNYQENHQSSQNSPLKIVCTNVSPEQAIKATADFCSTMNILALQDEASQVGAVNGTLWKETQLSATGQSRSTLPADKFKSAMEIQDETVEQEHLQKVKTPPGRGHYGDT